MVLKAHGGECTSIVCKEGMLISTGKDYKVCIHSAVSGTYEFVKQVTLNTQYIASSLDFMDGKVLIGHDNGVIATLLLQSEQ